MLRFTYLQHTFEATYSMMIKYREQYAEKQKNLKFILMHLTLPTKYKVALVWVDVLGVSSEAEVE